MKIKFVLFLSLSLIGSLHAATNSPTEVFLKLIEKLDAAYSLEYNVETRYHHRGEDKTMHTHIKQKKLSYDPYLGYSFYKQMDKDTEIYYHFLELGIVEKHKNMLTVFDHNEDPTFPRHVSSYSNDLENLWQVVRILEVNKDGFTYESTENIKGRKYYKYRVRNYFLWVDVKTELPFRIESVSNNGNALTRDFSDIKIDQHIEDSEFAYPKNAGYVEILRTPNPDPLVGENAPDWSLKNMNNKTVRSDDYKGKPKFIEVWSADCGFCVASFPTVKEISDLYGDSVEVITVNIDYDIAKAKKAINEHDLSFTVLQGDAAFQRDYLVRSFPSYYVIDANGKVLLHKTGAIRSQAKDDLYETLDKVK